MSGILRAVVVALLIATALLVLAYLEISPIYMVAGDSMYPTLLNGDIVFVMPAKLGIEIKEGDIIVYKLGRTYIIHRVIKIVEYEGRGYIVKGDNNPAPDPVLVRDNMIVAKVVEINEYPAKTHIIPTFFLMVGLDLLVSRRLKH